MSADLIGKGSRFRDLHAAPGAFLIANVWDGGSARILGGLGFQALATSSGASAGTLGRLDGQVTREEALAQARLIAGSTGLPVSADLEKGFGDSPEAVAETLRLAGATGLVGASIEDATGDPRKPLFGLGQAFERAGADVLFAPGLPDLDAVRTVCSSLSKPVNFMVGIPGKSFSVPELAEAGVKRISFATSLYRAAMSGLIAAAREAKEKGTFGFVESAVSSRDLAAFLSPPQ
jgi:2-methylisocitrate lyase-like PEP mutase family enzyme